MKNLISTIQWVSVDKVLPTLEERVLIAYKGSVKIAYLYDDDGEIKWEIPEHYGLVVSGIEYWAHLPSPPPN